MSEMVLRKKLVECIDFFSDKGWIPATSSNFSARLSLDRILISRSGVDKSKFDERDLILSDLNGTVIQSSQRASAETLIHCELYNHFPEVGCVLHTHSVIGTVVSRRYAKTGLINFTGYEIQKAFQGITSHLSTVSLPIISNSQSMTELIDFLDLGAKIYRHGFLIEGHGLYSWGKDVASAKRAIEAFEFLMECHLVQERLQ